jgi:hypothetical protein
MAIEHEFIGEVIEASTSEFTAESYTLHAPPRFGSFVKIPLDGAEEPAADLDDPFASPNLHPAIYAVVYSATTTSTEGGKQPRAYWKDEDELAREQPQLAEWLLMTKFQAAIVGYAQGNSIRQYLPPVPPKIHTQVFECSADEIACLTNRMDFLRTLVGFRNAPSDEMVAACIRECFAARGGDSEFLISAGKELANLLKDDYERLHAIVRRIVP